VSSKGECEATTGPWLSCRGLASGCGEGAGVGGEIARWYGGIAELGAVVETGFDVDDDAVTPTTPGGADVLGL